MEIKGKYTTAKVFTGIIEEEAVKQIMVACSNEAFKDSQIRIMPDVHAGKNCVIGFTSKGTDRIIPDIIGVDIGCGVLSVNLGKTKIKFDKLDDFIHKRLEDSKQYPMEVTFFQSKFYNDLKKLCSKLDTSEKKHLNELGTLGGGNHFIEIDKDSNQNSWLIIHCGSRSLEVAVAN